ncbi:TetR/AcrR family transcriptional regulator [Arthrobacter sp. SX1312]|uniref:TetR/AcrR family transcriptional regulator n=1 Tax=Arthrobacter sp. SX1312 TaxID=2058896 RepID=UPI000CE42443|nr:TetR/AcrR family transcriptional regulator [Arthrobacter sp. SX1312]
MTPAHPYHHGALRRAVLDAAVVAINEVGPAAVSLRDLARRAGVSHAAPAYHFGNKAGVLTAVAAEGHNLLADALTTAHERRGDFADVGVAYVRFAVDHRAHFEVMHRPELYDAADPDVVAARARTAHVLYAGVAAHSGGPEEPDVLVAGVAAWSLVHGFTSLWVQQALPPGLGDDLEAVARLVAKVLFSHESRSLTGRKERNDDSASA